MKRNILAVTAFTLLAGSVIFTSCKKDDITDPVVTLTGTDMTISLQGTFTDPGATADDNKDGALTPVVTGTVDKNLKGEYTITYTATDAAGNSASVTRKVTVKNDADNMNGTYSVAETPGGSTFPQTITASNTLNNRIHFNKFANYVNNTGIYADIVGTTVTLPTQLARNVGNPSADRAFAGTGNTTSTGLTLVFTETTNGQSDTYTDIFIRN